MKYLLLLLLVGCSKEKSYEGCVETTRFTWNNGEIIETTRLVNQQERNDTTYTIGNNRPAVVTIKTTCHER